MTCFHLILNMSNVIVRFFFLGYVYVLFFSLPNYNMVSKPTRISAHGGFIIYIHDSFQYKQVDIIDDSPHFENICIEVWNKYAHFDKFLICDIYKPP